MERQRDAARRSAEHMRDSFLRFAAGHPECIQFDWENAGVLAQPTNDSTNTKNGQ